MGEVFEAEHIHLQRRVAVKLLQRKIASDPEVTQRFQREARSTTGLGHPNIVDTIDFGFSDGQPFLVMEWLEGENLDQRLDRGLLDVATALDIATQAANGLGAAHERGVIHRDLKPANLFLTRDHRGALLVKVLDFGIAKLRLHETKLTATGVLIGTPNYMAPEQAEGDTIDARTDVYALGVILYEMLTGHAPFQGDTPLAVLHQHTSRLPVVPSARAPDRHISPELDALVMRCLAKRPDDRFATMQELATAISAATGATPAAPRPAPRRLPQASIVEEPDDDVPPPAQSRRWLVGIGVLVLVAAAGAGAFYLLRREPGTVRRDAGVVATSKDATSDALVVAVTPDAAVADANAPTPVGATFPLRGHAFAGTLVTRPAVPVAGEPLEVVVELTTLSQAARNAARAGKLSASLEVRYFKDHSLVEESTHVLDASGRFTTTLRLPHAAKHHAHVDLLIDGKEIDHAKVDLFPELR